MSASGGKADEGEFCARDSLCVNDPKRTAATEMPHRGANFSPVMPTKSPHFKWNDLMKKNLLVAGLFLVTLAMPLAAQAQGVPGGAAHGFNEGNRIAGPVGAVVGTAVGGVIGGVEGVLGVDHRYYVSDSPERPVVYRHHWRHRHHRRHM
jgi:hypothetical protein